MGRLADMLLKHGYTAGVGLAAVGVVIVGLALLWRGDGPTIRSDMLPTITPRPGKRRIPPKQAAADRNRRIDAFVKSLQADARSFNVDLEKTLFAPFPYHVSKGKWVLPARGGRLETEDLRLTTQTRRLATPLGGLGTYQGLNLVLTVENRTDGHIALRVLTTPSGQEPCRPKGQLKQPTLVLGPREALQRTECLAKRRDTLQIDRLEVLHIPALSYHYLIKLNPVAVLLPARTSAGHAPPPGHTLCAGVPRQAIEQGFRAGKVRWVDVIDFYARYSCDRFIFQPGYRRYGQAAIERPVTRQKIVP